MLQKAFQRALIGLPIGIFITYTITILVSLLIGEGVYSPVVPSLAAQAGGELNAVLLQYALSALLGMGLAAGSVVWENESWSLFRRTAVHLLITAGLMFPIAYINRWMPPTLLGVLAYMLIFIVAYAIIWGVQWMIWMRRVREINARLSRK